MKNDFLSQLAPRLLPWFDIHKRNLPWRENRDPYRVWLSEIMLQQTRVEAVKDYFLRFVAELPTVEALAAADEERLMRLWAGLGYYRRMRLLHQMAKVIVGELGGRFPETVAELVKLPGIGAYTAGAIASIAFEQPAPAVDGNVLRVLSRLSAVNDWTQHTAVAALAPCYPANRCGDFTQSLMELGAIVCLPNGAPHCDVCPMCELCQAFQTGRVAEFPAKAAKPVRPVEKLAVYLLRHDGKIALRKRPEIGLLAGLWELPNEPLTNAAPKRFGKTAKIRHTRHVFTHREWEMTVYEIAAEAEFPEFVWQKEAECALPSAFGKLLRNAAGKSRTKP